MKYLIYLMLLLLQGCQHFIQQPKIVYIDVAEIERTAQLHIKK